MRIEHLIYKLAILISEHPEAKDYDIKVESLPATHLQNWQRHDPAPTIDHRLKEILL